MTFQWPFLQRLLLKLGFPDKFVQRIMTCVVSVSYSLEINSSLGGWFMRGKGLRQDDPLSPDLFVLIMEFLNRKLQKIARV